MSSDASSFPGGIESFPENVANRQSSKRLITQQMNNGLGSVKGSLVTIWPNGAAAAGEWQVEVEQLVQ